MDAARYAVLTTSHFDRQMKRLLPKHPELLPRFRETLAALAEDPRNKSGKFAIRKFSGVPPGEGQYRLRSGRFRFCYDVEGNKVILLYSGLRREDTYA